MTTLRHAQAQWAGPLRQGEGRLRLGSDAFEGPYSFPSRFENGSGTNPEELLAAAHAGCFSMGLVYVLETDGIVPRQVRTRADVHLVMTTTGPTLPRIDLHTEVDAEGLDAARLLEYAERAKATCLLSRALTGVPTITVSARLLSTASAEARR